MVFGERRLTLGQIGFDQSLVRGREGRNGRGRLVQQGHRLGPVAFGSSQPRPDIGSGGGDLPGRALRPGAARRMHVEILQDGPCRIRASGLGQGPSQRQVGRGEIGPAPDRGAQGPLGRDRIPLGELADAQQRLGHLPLLARGRAQGPLDALPGRDQIALPEIVHGQGHRVDHDQDGAAGLAEHRLEGVALDGELLDQMHAGSRPGHPHAQDRAAVALDELGLELGRDRAGQAAGSQHGFVDAQRSGHALDEAVAGDVLGTDLVELGVEIGDLGDVRHQVARGHLARQASLLHGSRGGDRLEDVDRVDAQREADQHAREHDQRPEDQFKAHASAPPEPGPSTGP